MQLPVKRFKIMHRIYKKMRNQLNKFTAFNVMISNKITNDDSDKIYSIKISLSHLQVRSNTEKILQEDNIHLAPNQKE